MSAYYTKTLRPFIEQLIRNNYSFIDSSYQLEVDSLDDNDLQEFAMHLFEYDGRDLYSISENNNLDDIVSSLFNLFKKDDAQNKLNFAETTRDNIVKFYKPKMQELIDEVIPFVESEDFIEAGRSKIYQENGESLWI